MDFSVVGIEKASRVYNKQDRIAELNQKHPVKSVQEQEDRVSISQSGKRLLLESQNPNPPSASPKTSSQVNITV
jgi:hypothetical protein